MSLTLDIEKKMGSGEAHRCDVPVIDMHLHFVDFMQRTDRFYSRKETTGLMQTMEDGNIAKAVVFGLPVKKKWEFFEPVEPSYYLDDNAKCTYFASTDEIVAYNYQGLAEEDQCCIAPTINGFDPTDRSAIEYVRALWDKYPFWKGIGEILFRHDDLTNLTVGETARCNHPAMYPVYQFCVEKEIPITIHQNSTAVSSSMASGATKPYAYKHELEEVLSDPSLKDLKLVWAHCGVSRRVEHKNYHRMIAKMMQRYPNLMVDFSWVAYENVICYPKKNPDDPAEPLVPREEWISEVILAGNNQDRIMLGSDLCGHFASETSPYHHGCVMARYNGLLEALKPHGEVREKIAFKNADRLFFNQNENSAQEHRT